MAQGWYLGKGGNRSGPFTPQRLRQMAANGEIVATDLVWREGMADWVAASSVAGLLAAPAPGSVAAPSGGGANNPYAAPDTSAFPIDAAAGSGSIQFAEFMPRVGAYLLDMIFLGLMTCIPGFGILFLFVGLAGRDQDAQAVAGVGAQMCIQFLALVIGAIYFVTLETSPKQGTWGKQIVGIKVTDLEGKRITVGKALGRFFAKILTNMTCGIGWLMPLFTEKKQTLHDLLAGCLALKQ